MTTNKEKETKSGTIVKLGIDVHARSYVVCRQIDGSTPQPAQRFILEGLLSWVAKQVGSGAKVYSCYEAGPLGFSLHRQLESMGVKNVVIQPQKLDERGKGIKTDKIDAQMLVQRLDRYANGNAKALSIVRVPSREEEQARSEVRQCEQMKKHRQRAILQGHGLLMRNGYIENKGWHETLGWMKICQTAPESIRKQLEVYMELIRQLTKQIKELTKGIEAKAPRELPLGLGCYTYEVLLTEIGNWGRFNNRQEVGSYTGLCPRERSSGGMRQMGSINKHGNARVRHALVELSWRLTQFQPNYVGTQKFEKLCPPDSKVPAGKKKKAIVAMARCLAIDLWRINTGQITAEKVGLALKQHPDGETMKSISKEDLLTIVN